jgi:hypothetical protein
MANHQHIHHRPPPPTARWEAVNTPIDGVADTSATITGTTIAWADPIDLPVADHAAALVLLHIPLYTDPGRHHQPTAADYLAWLVEVIDEAERVLERGGRLVTITLPNESRQPHIDTATQLNTPLIQAGFTIPATYTWLPGPAHPDNPQPPTVDAEPPPPLPSRRLVLVASKNHPHRAGTTRQRRKHGLPHDTTNVADHLTHLANSDLWPIPTNRPGQHIRQGDLPPNLVALIMSLFTYTNDVVITPLTGASTVVTRTANQLQRRALSFEPDHNLLTALHQQHDLDRADHDHPHTP